MNYKYVIYNLKDSYHEPLFKSLNAISNVSVHEGAFEGNRILKRIFFWHWSSKINKKMYLPLKSVWFKRMCPTNNKTCYIFYNGKYITEDKSLVKYIKKKNPKNKIVIIFDDLIKKMYQDASVNSFSMADLVCSYDKDECLKFDARLLENIYYAPLLEITTPEYFENDVYFLGYAKDRLEEIHMTWKVLTGNGVKCLFLLAGVKENQRLNYDEMKNSVKSRIVYIDNPIEYRENLKNVINSRCILEITQKNTVAITLRCNEAVCYKRKLITNCSVVKDSILYCDKNMLIYTKVEDITPEFCIEPINYEVYKHINNLSGKEYIQRVEDLLSENNGSTKIT